MERVNLDGREFRTVRAGEQEPGPNGATGHYHQAGDLVWAEFSGAHLRTGRLVGTYRADGVIEAAYCQVMMDGTVMAGRCLSTPIVLDDGRVRVEEQWNRIDGSTGISHIQEAVDVSSAVLVS